MLKILRDWASTKGSYTLDPMGQKAVNKAVVKALDKALDKALERALAMAVPKILHIEVKSAVNNSLKAKPPRLAAGVIQYSPAVAQRALSEYKCLLHMGDAMPGSLVAYREWRDALRESGVPVMILFRHLARYESALEQYPDDDLVFARTDVDVDQVVKLCTNMSACFATTLTGNFLTLLRYDHIKPIFIGHGDSDKVSSSRRGMRAFDEIWVAGDAHQDRLASILMGVPTRTVGRPQIKPLLSESASSPRSGAYLPTWEGNLDEANYSSLAIAHEIIDEIAKVSKHLVVKLHPSSGFRVSEYAATKFEELPDDVELAPSSSSPMPIMADAAFCVTDVSSIVTDYLATGRPVFLFDAGKAKLETKMPLEDYCYVFRSADELGELLDQVIERGDDPLREARHRASSYLISRDATLNDEFGNSLRNI